MPNFIDSRYGTVKTNKVVNYWLVYQVKHYDGGGVNKIVDLFSFAVVNNYLFQIYCVVGLSNYVDPSQYKFLGNMTTPYNDPGDIQIISLQDEDLTIDDLNWPLVSDDTTFFKNYRNENRLSLIFNQSYMYSNLTYGFLTPDRLTPLCFTQDGGKYYQTIIRQPTLKRWLSWTSNPRLPQSWIQIDPDDQYNKEKVITNYDDDVIDQDREEQNDEQNDQDREGNEPPGTTDRFTPAVGYGSTVFGNRFINYPLKAKIDNEMTVWLWHNYPEAIATWYVLFISFNLPVAARKYFLWSGLGFTQYTQVDAYNESKMNAIIHTHHFQREIKDELANRRPFETFTNQIGMELDYLINKNALYVPTFDDFTKDTQERIRGIKPDWTIYTPESFNWQGQLNLLLTQFGYLT